MAGLNDIMGVLQTGVAVLSELQQTQSKLVPTYSSGYVDTNKLIQSGFVRVLGISVMAGTALLHDAAGVPNVAPTNAIYALPATPGFYPTNMVFVNGLVLAGAAGVKCAIFYSRV
jgi:hypothetical protein